MSNTTSIIMAVIVVGLIVFDAVSFDSANLVFLGKKFLELISYIAFWR